MTSKYLKPTIYLNHGLLQLNLHLLEHVEFLLAPDSREPLRHPPIFFLGAPRSGSTLMIQVITDALDVGYVSNRHCQFFGAPALAEHLFHPLVGKPCSDYRSHHGRTDAMYEPAECGEWWYRFFPRQPAYVAASGVKPQRMRAFRRSIAALTKALDCPVVFKNLYASLRVQAIAKYVPESLFIVTRRNEVDNAHSLLEARYRTFGDYEPWFSVEPPGVERLKSLPPHEQVVEQIREIHRVIDIDFKGSGLPESRRLDLDYGEFCADTGGAIEKVQSFLRSHGCKVQRAAAVPAQFDQREEIRIASDLYEALSRYSSKS